FADKDFADKDFADAFPTVRDVDSPNATTTEDRPVTIGYLARLAPEKGLRLLADAFIRLRRRRPDANLKLHIAGWCGSDLHAYRDSVFQSLRDAGCGDDFQYLGELNRQAKVEFFRSIDLFSVPTTYREPKGLYVLEAMASGVPVVQPNHGAFPEMLRRLPGGVLFDPENADSLADTLEELVTNEARRRELGENGRTATFRDGNIEIMAQRVFDVFQNA
ncbi:MAG: glycosyltransferase family 4 protein, partial [Planctomycetales bacterium]|nr:glycosyltransferase family 4 protein [Planctomycetales bacterium]